MDWLLSHFEGSSDRRRSPRASFSGITIVRVDDDDLPCLAADVSEHGMLVFPRRSQPLSSDQRVTATFTLPNLERWIAVEAHVVRTSRRPRPCWGLQFSALDEHDRQLLREYVATALRQPKAAQVEPPAHDWTAVPSEQTHAPEPQPRSRAYDPNASTIKRGNEPSAEVPADYDATLANTVTTLDDAEGSGPLSRGHGSAPMTLS